MRDPCRRNRGVTMEHEGDCVRSGAAKDLARRFVETLGGRRPLDIRHLFAEDAVIHSTGTSCIAAKRSPQEFIDLLKELGAVVPKGLRLEIRNIIAEGDQAACEVVGTALTADGRAYNNHYVFWLRESGGKIALLLEFLDTRLVDEIFKAPA